MDEIRLILLELKKQALFDKENNFSLDLHLRIFCTQDSGTIEKIKLRWAYQDQEKILAISQLKTQNLIAEWDKISKDSPGIVNKKSLLMPPAATHFIISYTNPHDVEKEITQRIAEKTDLLPSNATDYERVLALTAARLSDLSEAIVSPFNIQKTAPQTLPWLAWLFSVAEWNPSLDTQSQRNLIANSVKIHTKKGTRAAIEKAMQQIGDTLEIEEWWEEKQTEKTFSRTNQPYHFSVNLNLNKSVTTLDAAKLIKIKNTIDQLKPASTDYDIRLKADLQCSVGIVAVGFALTRLSLTMQLSTD
jgi:phage tail P2-like protein